MWWCPPHLLFLKRYQPLVSHIQMNCLLLKPNPALLTSPFPFGPRSRPRVPILEEPVIRAPRPIKPPLPSAPKPLFRRSRSAQPSSRKSDSSQLQKAPSPSTVSQAESIFTYATQFFHSSTPSKRRASSHHKHAQRARESGLDTQVAQTHTDAWRGRHRL